MPQDLANEVAKLGAAERARVAEKLRAKLNEAKRTNNEPLAIVGIGCRLPGGADNPEAYWRVLRDGVDAKSTMGAERWGPVEGFYDPSGQSPGKSSTRCFGLLRGRVDEFDAAFFGIPPREAKHMDPQQRLLLEVCWESLEDAGIRPETLFGTQTGVFVGISTPDYFGLQYGDYSVLDGYSGTGCNFSVAAGRISYVLGLRGPAMVVDTACSSSLVALHLACQSLRAGESDAAVVLGVNLLLSPGIAVAFSKAGMLAPDGPCRTFDAGANGYMRAEGCGGAVLKRLPDAIRDGDNVLALIRGTAVNQDGRSSGLTAPNGPSQQDVIRRALGNAGVAPKEVGYVECHGTGTPLGDPIEVQALGAVLGEGRPAVDPVVIGSSKANIGHAEAAAGIAGLIKVVLSLQNRAIPPQVHLQQVNPNIPIDRLPVELPTALTPWKPILGRRIAGLSSFGFSGTNVHVVIEEAPNTTRTESFVERPRHLLTLSAKSDDALHALAERYAGFFATDPAQALGDICFTANTGRSRFEHRLAVHGRSHREMGQHLNDFVAGKRDMSTVEGIANGSTLKVAFLFTGQGAQYFGMARSLFETQSTFRAALQRCADLLEGKLPRPLLDVLYGEPESSLLSQTRFTQPAIFAIQVALCEMLEAWGITPAAVMGHSVGEFAAAWKAGIFTLEDALGLIAERARLMQSLPAGGEMVALAADEATVATLVERHADSVSIAAINGPKSVVVSGAADNVRSIVAELAASGVRAQPLEVSHAFHSPLMEPIADAFEATSQAIRHQPSKTTLVCNVTGQPLERGRSLDAKYWRRHLREPVAFTAGVKALRELGCNVFVEIGPTPTLIAMARRCVSESEPVHWVPTLRKKRDDWEQMLAALGTLFVSGADIDWRAFDRDYPRRKARIPTYAFQRSRFWIDTQRNRAVTSSVTSSSEPPLFGRRLSTALDAVIFETEIGPERPSFLGDHRMHGRLIVPLVAYLEFVYAGAARTYALDNVTLCEVAIHAPLVLTEGETVKLQLVFSPPEGGMSSFKLAARRDETASTETSTDERWSVLVTGKVSLAAARAETELPRRDLEDVRSRCKTETRGVDHYHRLEERGSGLGAGFQCIDRILSGDKEALLELRLPEKLGGEADEYGLHPVLMDGALQFLAGQAQSGLFLALGVERISITRNVRARTRALCHYRQGPISEDTVTAEVGIYDGNGEPIVFAEGLHMKLAPQDVLQRWIERERQTLTHHLEWRRIADGAPAPALAASGTWLILGDSDGVQAALTRHLEAAGAKVKVVFSGPSDLGRSVIDPRKKEDFEAVLTEVDELGGIVHLWALDSASTDATTPASLEDDHARSLTSVLLLTQVLATRRAHDRPRIWIATKGAQSLAVPNDRLHSLAQSGSWGLGPVLGLEHPDMWGGLIDLDPDATPEESALALLRELASEDLEDRVAVRSKQRFALRLGETTLSSSKRVDVRADATYLITGGLGGLGLLLARWMVDRGARHLALMGRRRKRSEAVEKLRRDGVRVLEVFGDVADESDVRAALDKISREMPPLRGIAHAAGVLRDRMLQQMEPSEFAEVLAPKVAGAWNLHLHSQALPLDFFWLFSSVTAFLPQVGQGNYAAANAFMDALALYRHEQGLPALTLNWGPWGEVGMAVDALGAKASQNYGAQGMRMLRSDEGLRILEEFGREEPQLVVVSLDKSAYRRHFPNGDIPLLRDGTRAPAAATPAGPAELREIFERARPAERRRVVFERLQGLLSQSLATTDVIDPALPLAKYGLDSLVAVELRSLLSRQMGQSLPVTLMFERPTLGDLTEFVLESFGMNSAEDAEMSSSIVAAFAEAPKTAGSVLDHIEGMSDEEVERLLGGKLGDVGT